MFGIAVLKGVLIMTDLEKEVIEMMKNYHDPEEALMIATSIVIELLKQHESDHEPSVACLQAIS